MDEIAAAENIVMKKQENHSAKLVALISNTNHLDSIFQLFWNILVLLTNVKNGLKIFTTAKQMHSLSR